MNPTDSATSARRWSAVLLAATWVFAAQARSETPATAGITGTWRFTHALPAPWGKALAGSPDLAGKTLTVTAKSIDGPRPFACKGVHAETVEYPAPALFQGVLPEPAERAAQTLGLNRFPVPSTSLRCSTGIFEFHRADRDTLLVGLDNRVWTLSRAPGATAPDTAPESVVERLLEAHFGGDMGFSPQSAERKKPYLSAGLRKAVADYFGHPEKPGEVPAIDGDPFTDSQEYPTRFAVGRADVEGNYAQVEVTFADAWRSGTLRYRLNREARGWRLDDVVYPDGRTLRGLLR